MDDLMTKTYLTRTYSDIYPELSFFQTDYNKFCKLELSEDEQEELWLLIMSKYGDSHVRYTNETLFALRLFKEVNCYWPMVQAIRRDQKRLREATNEDFQKGGEVVTNAGAHNTSDIQTDADSGAVQLNAQNVTNTKRNELGVLIDRQLAYKADEEDRFLDGLKPLFIQILQAQRDLLYVTEVEDNDA